MKNGKLKLIDTHAHVNLGDFEDDYKEVIKRSLDEDTAIINVGTDKESSEKAIKIAEEYPDSVFVAVGTHPNGNADFDYDYFLKLASGKKVVGIGETGLDYFRVGEQQERNKQKELFEKHVRLAVEINKPLIIHCREAHDDMLEILSAGRQKLKDKAGVMHFFTGTLEQAQKYIDLGFYVSFSGVVTFVKEYESVVKNIPMEKILVETDCPFATPIPHRGKKNEPSYVKYVAQKIAEIKGVNFDEVAEQTTKNARELFGI